MVLKTTYERFPPKLLTYRSYEHSWNDSLVNKFKSEAYATQSGDIGSLKSVITKNLKTVVPFKKRIVRGNNKPHITSFIREKIMTRSKLKNNPAGNCMFKVNNRNTRTRCEICSKLTIKTPERR